MTQSPSTAFAELLEVWQSVPVWHRNNTFKTLGGNVARSVEKGLPVDMNLLCRCLTDLCDYQDAEKRLALASGILKISGPICFENSWDPGYVGPMRAALQTEDMRLIELFHDHGAKLCSDNDLYIGMALGKGFWCSPEHLNPGLKDTGDLFGFVLGIMAQKKECDEDMEKVARSIDAFAKWADAESLPDRITSGVITWQGRQGNSFWITGQPKFQVETLAALIRIGLDIEPAIKAINLNSAETEKERAQMYRDAASLAISSQTAPVHRASKSHRL